ncbi:MAG: protein translocase subunit SecF [Candidatus Roizmanbacteria bacterium]|nr:MAG: protein translocase subunit SecF [Candidatus Roizmanbacteria bacterium]
MINFLKYRWIYYTISFAVIALGLFSIIRWGFIYSIDFVGGTNLQYQTSKNINQNEVKQIFEANEISLIDFEVKNNTIIVRAKTIDEKKEAQIKNDLEKKLSIKLTVLKSETVGPVLGKELIRKTIIASLMAVVIILLYMSFAFKGLNFALAAVIALFHDFLVVIGSYSLLSHFFGAQVDTLFVTAVLITMSFSVHDTIVIFDKIREYKKNIGSGDIEHYANKALTETLVRSVNNSMTIIFMLLALVLLGGATIKFFVITLLIGTITGTYSSPFVATPVVVWLEKLRKK